MNHPDRLTIDEIVLQEIQASSVILKIAVRGKSFFAGDIALKKAVEVKKLVDDFIDEGIKEVDIRVKDIVSESDTNLLNKSSSVIYHLNVKLRDFEKLNAVLGILSNCKHANLEKLDWQFKDDWERRQKWIEQALQSAYQRAERMATVLGVGLEGVYDCRVSDIHNNWHRFDDFYAAKAKGSYTDDSSPLSEWQKRGVEVIIEFRLSPFKSGSF